MALEAIGRVGPDLINAWTNLERMDAIKGQNEREAIKFGYEKKKMDEEQKRLDMPVPYEMVLGKFAQWPSAQKHFQDVLDKSGVVQDINGVKYVRNRDLANLKEMMKSNSEISQGILAGMHQDHSANYMNALQAYNQEQNPEKKAKLAEQVKMAEKEFQASLQILHGAEFTKAQLSHNAQRPRWLQTLVDGKLVWSSPDMPGKSGQPGAVFGEVGVGNTVAGVDEAGNPIITPSRGPITPGNTKTLSLPEGSTVKGSPVLPSEQQTAITQFKTLTEGFDEVKKFRDSSEMKKKSNAWLGPVAASAYSLVDVTPFADQDRASLRANLQGIQNKITYMLSGKQINEEEARRLKKELPKMDDQPVVFDVKMKKFEREWSAIRDSKVRMITAGKYRGWKDVVDLINEPSQASGDKPASAADPVAKALAGQKPGIYRSKSGKSVKWDGTKIIE